MSSGNNSGSQNGPYGSQSANLSGTQNPNPAQDCTATAANRTRRKSVNEILKESLMTMRRTIDTLLAILEFNERELAARNCCQPPQPCSSFAYPPRSWPCSVPLASVPQPPFFAQPQPTSSEQQQQQPGSQQQQQEQPGSQQVSSAISEHVEDCIVEDRGPPVELASRIVSQRSFGNELEEEEEGEADDEGEGEGLEVRQSSYETVGHFSASMTDASDVSSTSGSGERVQVQSTRNVQAVQTRMSKCKQQSGVGSASGQQQDGQERIIFSRVEARLNPDSDTRPENSIVSHPCRPSGPARRCVLIDVDRYDRMDQMFSDTEDYLLAAHDKIESSYVRVCQLGDMYREEMSNIRIQN